MAESAPALCSTRTLCPASTSAFTPAGVTPTRLSWSFTSLGTPIIIRSLLKSFLIVSSAEDSCPADRPKQVPTNGRPQELYACPDRYTHHEVVSLRAGGPSGRT